MFHVADYNSPLPEIIYLDTGFIYEIYGDNPQNKFTDDCYNFTNRLAANGSIMVVSSLTFHELDHLVLRGIYQKHSRGIGWMELLKQTKEYMSEVAAEINRMTNLLHSNPNIAVIPVNMDEKFTELRRKAMFDYSLDVTDAGHVVTCLQNAVNSYAVIDIDYQNIPNVNIFTPNQNYPRLRNTPKQLIAPPELTETAD